MIIANRIAAMLLACALPASTVAQTGTVPTPAPVAIDSAIVTTHSGIFNGRRIAYEATIEPFATTGLDGKPAARIVAISYTAKRPTCERPVVFIFNGGPIVASSTLHMGAFGPKRVAVPADIAAPPSSFRLTDNSYTLLDVADLVFFDPAGTGFSRVAPGVDPASQFSVKADARQLEQVVLAWKAAHGRMAAPVYLLGESYGTMRAPEAAAQLAAAGSPPAGVILLGQAVNILEYAQRRGNIISYAVSLPTLAAVAWWHGKAERKGREFDAFVRDAQAYGGGEYLSALFAGDTAPLDRRQAVAAKLQEFTGIPASYWLAHALRMTKVEYQRALFPGKVLETNDARYVSNPDGPSTFGAIGDAYTANFRTYLASDLGAAKLGDYVFSSAYGGGLNGWDWGPNKSPFGDWPYGQALTDRFAKDPKFRLFVGNGYYDTQTTIGAMDYLVSQSGWPRDRVRTAYYQGGHMSYTIEASLKRFSDDVRAMITGKW